MKDVTHLELTDFDLEFLKFLKSPMGKSMGDIIAFYLSPEEAQKKLAEFIDDEYIKKTDLHTFVLTDKGKQVL